MLCCLVSSLWKVPWAYSAHIQIISCSRKKKKKEFLALRQLHKRLAYVKNTELSPCECYTINQIPDLVSLLPVKWWYSPNPLLLACACNAWSVPSALICFQIACFRNFLYILWKKKGRKKKKQLLLKAPVRVYSTEHAPAFQEGGQTVSKFNWCSGAEHSTVTEAVTVGAEEWCAACPDMHFKKVNKHERGRYHSKRSWMNHALINACSYWCLFPPSLKRYIYINLSTANADASPSAVTASLTLKQAVTPSPHLFLRVLSLEAAEGSQNSTDNCSATLEKPNWNQKGGNAPARRQRAILR